MSYRYLLHSNAKLLTLYFIGTFITLLVFVWLQYNFGNLSGSGYNIEIESQQLQNSADNIIPDEDISISIVPKSEFTISQGDTLQMIMHEAGISYDRSQKIIMALKKIFDPRKLKIGTHITFDYGIITLENDLDIKQMVVRISKTQEIKITNYNNTGYEASLINIPFSKKIVRLSTTIKTSFVKAARNLHIPYDTISTMIKAYSYDVDFQRDIKEGNVLDVLVNKFYTNDGNFSHFGDIIYSSLHLRDRKIDIYKFDGHNKKIAYYNKNAVSVVKQFLRTPIKAAPISSGFGMRFHPVLGFSRMHKGVDFAAAVGTPILAAGDGIFSVVGHKTGYGNYIRIKHNSIYSTAYGHLKRFAKGVKRGQKIKQGQVIGYVGMTGITSGPHLHYEVLKNGVQINPRSLKSAPRTKLQGKRLEQFKIIKKNIHDILKSTEYS